MNETRRARANCERTLIADNATPPTAACSRARNSLRSLSERSIAILMSTLATLTTIIDELIRTELTFLDGIKFLLHSYRPALLRLVPSLAIFDGLEAIQKVSEELLGRLEPIPLASSVAAAEASAEAEALSWTAAALGAALVPRGGGAAEHALNRYRPFINTFDASLRTARELLELPSFGGRVRAVAASLGSTHTLADLLITPIQRPPRYVMLLEAAVAALEKGGGDGAGGGAVALRAALEVVRDVVSALNEAKRERDAVARMREVQARLRDGVLIEHPCRRLVCEAAAAEMVAGGGWAPRVLLLFSDLLLVATEDAAAPTPPRRGSAAVDAAAAPAAPPLTSARVVRLDACEALDATAPRGARAQLPR